MPISWRPGAKTINVFWACLGAQLTICAQKWRNFVLFSAVSLIFVLSRVCVFLYSPGPKMTVTRTARSTWIVIGLTIRYSTINIFGGHVLTRTPRSPFTNFIPSQVVGPPGQQLDRVVSPLAKLSASGRRVDANRRHWMWPVPWLAPRPRLWGRRYLHTQTWPYGRCAHPCRQSCQGSRDRIAWRYDLALRWSTLVRRYPPAARLSWC